MKLCVSIALAVLMGLSAGTVFAGPPSIGVEAGANLRQANFNGREGIYIVAGPAYSYTQKAKLVDQKQGSQTAPDDDLKADKTVETSDFSVIGGLGFTAGKIAIEARADIGLKNLNKDTDKDQFK